MPTHKHLKRLDRVFVEPPVFFITTCTHQRTPILTLPPVARILIEEWQGAQQRHGWLVGRYVIMPDHVHFFCTLSGENPKTLSAFMQQWKQWTSKRILRESCSRDGPSRLQELRPPIWQKGFFDHLLRSNESYAQKWEYVYRNPIRAGLVTRPEDWPWQGEIHEIT